VSSISALSRKRTASIILENNNYIDMREGLPGQRLLTATEKYGDLMLGRDE
jgi:hypothetical protein